MISLQATQHYGDMRNILITGAGRSGTSLLAGLFPKGYYRGGEQVAAWAANPKGFFESKEVNWINELLLSQKTPNNFSYKNLKKGIRSNFTSNKGFDFGERWLFYSANEELQFTMNSATEERITKILSQQPFCLKDPRFSLTLQAWDSFLPENTRIIQVFRSPLQTASSLIRFAQSRKTKYLKQMDFITAIKIWHFQNQQNLRNFKSSNKKWLFIHYDQIKQEKAIKSLEDFADTQLENSFFDPNLNRSEDSECEVPNFAMDTYKELCKLANYKG